MKNEIKTINIIIANLECKVTFFFFYFTGGWKRKYTQENAGTLGSMD